MSRIPIINTTRPTYGSNNRPATPFPSATPKSILRMPTPKRSAALFNANSRPQPLNFTPVPLEHSTPYPHSRPGSSKQPPSKGDYVPPTSVTPKSTTIRFGENTTHLYDVTTPGTSFGDSTKASNSSNNSLHQTPKTPTNLGDKPSTSVGASPSLPDVDLMKFADEELEAMSVQELTNLLLPKYNDIYMNPALFSQFCNIITEQKEIQELQNIIEKQEKKLAEVAERRRTEGPKRQAARIEQLEKEQARIYKAITEHDEAEQVWKDTEEHFAKKFNFDMKVHDFNEVAEKGYTTVTFTHVFDRTVCFTMRLYNDTNEVEIITPEFFDRFSDVFNALEAAIAADKNVWRCPKLLKLLNKEIFERLETRKVPQ